MSKVILITGASSGIGKSAAEFLSAKGFKVYGTGRNPKINEKNGYSLIPLDVTKPETISLAIDSIIKIEGRLDVLVNNAGYGQFGCTEDITLDDFRKQFETNFFSIVRIIQEVSPIMRNQKSGTIVNISSVVGKIGLPGSPAYISTKFALEGFSECLRYELGQFGIKITLIEPGVIKTNFFNS